MAKLQQNLCIPGLPSQVLVYYPSFYLDGTYVITGGIEIPSYYTSTISLSGLNVTGVCNGVSGNGNVGSAGYKYFHDTCPAYYTNHAESLPNNQSQLDALANQIAIDFYNYKSWNYDIVYNGIVEWDGDGLTDCIEWTYEKEEITTRVKTGPINAYPEELKHAPPTIVEPIVSGEYYLTSGCSAAVYSTGGCFTPGVGHGAVKYVVSGANMCKSLSLTGCTVFSWASTVIATGLVAVCNRRDNGLWIDQLLCSGG